METMPGLKADRVQTVVISSLMDRGGETGVQRHINDFLHYLGERKCIGLFVGNDETVRGRTASRILAGILRRLTFVEPQSTYALLNLIALHASRATLRRTLRGHLSWVVYAQDPTCARAALALRKNSRQRVVISVHFNVSQADEMVERRILRRGGRLYRLIQKREEEALSNVDGVVFFSQFMQREILRRGLVLKSQTVIPNTAMKPIPDTDFKPRDILSIGSLEPRKNQSFLLQVLREALNQGYSYSLTLVGSGVDRDKLEALAEELGLKGSVLFLGRHPTASSLLSAHKIVVHAAKVENLPISLVEALAAGKPILAPRVGGIPEVYTDGVEGFFWPLDSPLVAATILIQIMENKLLRSTMSAAAALRYETQFKREVIFGRLFSFVCEG